MASIVRRAPLLRTGSNESPRPSSWTRPLVVIRVPRFTPFARLRRHAAPPEDGPAAFLSELQLEASRRR